MTDAAHTGGVGDEPRPKIDPEFVERLMADAGEEAKLLGPDGWGRATGTFPRASHGLRGRGAVIVATESRPAPRTARSRASSAGAGPSKLAACFAGGYGKATAATSVPGSANAERVGASSRMTRRASKPTPHDENDSADRAEQAEKGERR
jgi:hypothetical protein